MRLVRTHDGQLGWCYENKTRWFNTVSQAKHYAAMHWNFDRMEYDYFSREVDYAINHMAKNGHTIAEFGVLGGFMFTTVESEYEF